MRVHGHMIIMLTTPYGNKGNIRTEYITHIDPLEQCSVRCGWNRDSAQSVKELLANIENEQGMGYIEQKSPFYNVTTVAMLHAAIHKVEGYRDSEITLTP